MGLSNTCPFTGKSAGSGQPWASPSTWRRVQGADASTSLTPGKPTRQVPSPSLWAAQSRAGLCGLWPPQTPAPGSPQAPDGLQAKVALTIPGSRPALLGSASSRHPAVSVWAPEPCERSASSRRSLELCSTLTCWLPGRGCPRKSSPGEGFSWAPRPVSCVLLRAARFPQARILTASWVRVSRNHHRMARVAAGISHLQEPVLTTCVRNVAVSPEGF